MTVSAPTHHNPWRGRRPGKATKRERATPAATSAQSVLMVDLASPEGRIWWAVGVGDTLGEALSFAQDSCPSDTNWQSIRWNDLYGD